MLTQEDLDNFQELLRTETQMAFTRIFDSAYWGSFDFRTPKYKQLIRLFCYKYNCADKYDEWVELLGRPYRERAKKGWRTRRRNLEAMR